MITGKPIKIPSGNEFKVFSSDYVYYKKNIGWDKEKMHSTDDGKCIGKVCKDDSSSFLPNSIYYCLFPNEPIKNEPAVFDDYLHFGSYIVLREATSKCGSLAALKKAFPDT